MKYFVSFYAECNDNIPGNIVVEVEEIKNQDDIESLEEFISWKVFGDDRIIKIINFKEL